MLQGVISEGGKFEPLILRKVYLQALKIYSLFNVTGWVFSPKSRQDLKKSKCHEMSRVISFRMSALSALFERRFKCLLLQIYVQIKL